MNPRIILFFFLGFTVTANARATASEEWIPAYNPTCWSYHKHFEKAGIMRYNWDLASEVATEINFTGESWDVNMIEEGLRCFLTFRAHAGAKFNASRILDWLRYNNGKTWRIYEDANLCFIDDGDRLRMCFDRPYPNRKF